MKKRAFALVFAFFTASILAFSQNETLVWSDEFDGTGGPDPDNWKLETGATGWGNQEVQLYTNLTQNAWQENGTLRIKAKKEIGGAWTSARIISLGKQEFKYGRIVWRAKLPTGIGTWPALWMLGSDILTVGWPKCGEIDVMEHVGRNPTVVSCAIHTPSSSGNTVNKKEKIVATFDTEFHEYEVNWTAQKLDFSIDGQLYYTYNPPVKNASTWPFDKPQFLIMNIAMGGILGSHPPFETGGLKNGIDPTLQSATMEIDWVRVYQKTVSTDENAAWPEGLRLSPNPSSGLFRAVVPEGETAIFQLSDALGQVIFEKELATGETELDFSAQPKGAFFVHFLVGKKRYSGKVILQ